MARYSPFAQRALEKETGMSFAEQMAEKAAKDAGFASAAAQMQNRMMRNQLEEKATRLGIPLSEAYALAGNDLTNTQALQEAWNKLVAPPKKEEPVVEQVTQPTTTPTVEPAVDPKPSAAELAIENLNKTIASMTSNTESMLANQANEFAKIQAAQDKRMAEMQNMMIQQAASQAERPTVTGVKTATGSSGDAMQIARRGVSGTFGRRGMRISSLNV
jgi:hypothetical protein